MLTGLLLGAGASYEAGMPLVWELSKQIRAILTPEYVRTTNNRHEKLNLNHPDYIVEKCISLLETESMHYESILGNLQVLARRAAGRGDGQHFHGVGMLLLEIVNWVLYDCHLQLERKKVIETQMRFLEAD